LIYILSDKIVDGVKNLNLLEIEFKDEVIDLKNFDALIFTSRNAIKAIDRLDKSWIDLEIFSIGEATADFAKSKGAKRVYFSKKSYGDELAFEIEKNLKGKRVLYVRGRKVASKLFEILQNKKIDISESILYESSCKSCFDLKKPENDSYIIFSSPSTIKCFFKCFSWHESYKALILGSTTAKFMPDNIKFKISPKPNFQEAVKFIISLR